jgi:exopolyphosphatase/guanosine-5'-triphosphate,3'-diphosphate pyrophosphatase
MQQVLIECDHAVQKFDADAVHDLRVAIRRCRSMADGLGAIDPNPEWKAMKKGAKALFSALGDLRDVQVMEEWIEQLGWKQEPAGTVLLDYLAGRESDLKHHAAVALEAFDGKQWRRWMRTLPARAHRFRPGGLLFRHLTLERWAEALNLHRQAMRNRSGPALHRVRIGLKRLRYIVENFLPEQHAAWGSDLKALQDALGEVHDLDVLWATAMKIHAFPDPESRARWHARIREEREQRVNQYRRKMTGPGSLWQVWRASLPEGKELEVANLSRVRTWAQTLDPDFSHAQHVTRLALDLYDGLARLGLAPALEDQQSRQVLRAAALMHEIGRAEGNKSHHKRSYKFIRNFESHPGWGTDHRELVAFVARYHRGALPQPRQKSYLRIPAERRKTALRLAAILRLANSFDAHRDRRIGRLKVQRQDHSLLILAQGYSPTAPLAEEIAAGRHLFEMLYRQPVLVRPLVGNRVPLQRVARLAKTA